MSDTVGSEYDVVTFKPNPVTWSIVCGLYSLIVVLMIHDLQLLLAWRLRYSLPWLLYSAMGANVVGLAVGNRARRHPERRGAAIFALTLNGFVLVLEVLFVLAFRWIMTR